MIGLQLSIFRSNYKDWVILNIRLCVRKLSDTYFHQNQRKFQNCWFSSLCSKELILNHRDYLHVYIWNLHIDTTTHIDHVNEVIPPELQMDGGCSSTIHTKLINQNKYLSGNLRVSILGLAWFKVRGGAADHFPHLKR